MNVAKRRQNEKEFKNWTKTSSGGRQYWFIVTGRNGGSARYVKDVDRDETTIAFRQEVFDIHGTMLEIHEKFPIDKGHVKIVQ